MKAAAVVSRTGFTPGVTIVCRYPLMCILSHPPPLESRVRFQFHRVLTTPAVLRCGVIVSPPPEDVPPALYVPLDL